MYHRMKMLGAGLILGLLAIFAQTGRSAELPSIGDLLGRVAALQEGIATLEQSGHLTQKQAATLNKKLDRVTKALGEVNTAAASGAVSAQQAQEVAPQQAVGDVLKGLQKAIDALLDFVSELTKLVTDLPSDVLQPIIDAALGLVRDLIGLLLG